MKTIFAMVGLATFLGAAFFVHQALEDTKDKQVIIGWSNSFVWSAVRSETAPRYLNPVLTRGDSKGHWQVEGEFEYRDAEGGIVHEPYRAVIAQTCPLRERRECWSLMSLAIAGQDVDIRTLMAQDADAQYAELTDDTDLPVPTDTQQVSEAETASPSLTGAFTDSNGRRLEAAPEEQFAALEVAPEQGAEAAEGPPASTASRDDREGGTRGDTPATAAAQTAAADLDERTLVLRIQQRLTALGFDPGVPDGFYGPRTRAAIRAYQLSQGLADEGEPSIQLLQRLERR